MEKADYDVVVIGAGHAGCEAAYAAARLGKRVLLTAIDLNSVAYLACNPSIGGVGKSHLVYEIDALGGIMPTIADKACIQMRTLNRGNGPAVQALRAQVDKHEYHSLMLSALRAHPNITIKECEVTEILTATKTQKTESSGVFEEGAPASRTVPRRTERSEVGEAPQTQEAYEKIPVDSVDGNNGGAFVTAVRTSAGETISCRCAVVATGVYLNSCILVGHTSRPLGPAYTGSAAADGKSEHFAAANHLTDSLLKLGLKIQRFKTGTPPRVAASSIDFSKTTPQPPDTDAHFSFMTDEPTRNAASCHLTYTNAETHKVIRDNLQKSAMYSGLIKGTGARYCPSIEDKIVRFASAERHQIFLEPESLTTDEIYLQGLSTSFPREVQKQFVQTIAGLEKADILRDAYAIEYDCIDSTQLLPTLEYKNVKNLFFAGQVNGTSGYEEAAAQGLIAGANAALSETEPSGVLSSDACGVTNLSPLLIEKMRGAKRISIIGPSGSGKSTLAVNLGEILGLPVYHTDCFKLLPNWELKDKDISLQEFEKTVAEDAWIIDGTYKAAAENRFMRSDVIIYLELPIDFCLESIRQRNIKKEKRIGLPDFLDTSNEKVDELAIKLKGWYKHNSNFISELNEKFGKKVIKLKSHQEINSFLDILKSVPQGSGAGALVLSRTQSYIGVLIDDLTTVGTKEPYRMFTSRAEHRLLLRQDNADRRLTPLGRALGLVDDVRWESFCKKLDLINAYKKSIGLSGTEPPEVFEEGVQASRTVPRRTERSEVGEAPQTQATDERTPDGSVPDEFPQYIKEIVAIEQMYEGYLRREQSRINEALRLEQSLIPAGINYDEITALRKESQIKLSAARPATIAAAKKISGVTPADINILLLWLRKHKS